MTVRYQGELLTLLALVTQLVTLLCQLWYASTGVVYHHLLTSINTAILGPVPTVRDKQHHTQHQGQSVQVPNHGAGIYNTN